MCLIYCFDDYMYFTSYQSFYFKDLMLMIR